MDKLTLRALKQYLKQRSQEELIADIADLFTRLDAVKDYYQLRLAEKPSAELLDKYKARIKDEFFPVRGFGEARLSIAKKPISEYAKISNSQVGLIDLMLYYVEMGVRFTLTYGDIDEPFYMSMESMYQRALKAIVAANLKDDFETRCYKIVTDTHQIGWGFHDMLSDMYDKVYSK